MRRRSDRNAQRLNTVLASLAVAMGILASVLGHRAIRAMGEAEEMREVMFKAGFVTGKARSSGMPRLDEMGQ